MVAPRGDSWSYKMRLPGLGNCLMRCKWTKGLPPFHTFNSFRSVLPREKKPAQLRNNSGSMFSLSVVFCLEKLSKYTLCFEWMAGFLQHSCPWLLLEVNGRGRKGQNEFIYRINLFTNLGDKIFSPHSDLWNELY